MSTELVSLTKAEIEERAQQLAKKISEHDAIDREKKESARNFKLRLDVVNREIRELSEAVKTGEEFRARTFFDNDFDN